MNDKDFDRQFATTKTVVKDMVRELRILKVDPRVMYFVLDDTTKNLKIALDRVYGKPEQSYP